MLTRRMREVKQFKEWFCHYFGEEVRQEKEIIKSLFNEEPSSCPSWSAKPITDFLHDWQNAKGASKWGLSEFSVFFKLRLLLPKEWIILNNVVLEPVQEQFFQLDHLVIGPPGVFIIETKTWAGKLTGYRNQWMRKEGKYWRQCSDPAEHNKRHPELFIKWLAKGEAGYLPLEPNMWVFPLVVFTKAKCLEAIECSVPVFDSGLNLSLFLRRQAGKQRLSERQVKVIGNAVVNAKAVFSVKFQARSKVLLADN